MLIILNTTHVRSVPVLIHPGYLWERRVSQHRHNISSLFLDLFHCEGKINIVECIRQRQLKDQKLKYFQILTEIKMKLLKGST